jgi:hypothetical protein
LSYLTVSKVEELPDCATASKATSFNGRKESFMAGQQLAKLPDLMTGSRASWLGNSYQSYLI